MFLRQTTENLRHQNWTAVVIDFLIVVLGVYIGIQAANWNDERQARELRDKLIDRLHAEAEEAVSYLHQYLQFLQMGAAARESVLRKAASGNIDDVQQDEIVTAVNYLVLFPPVAPPRSVYDEVVSAGQFTALGDEAVRNWINQYYSALDHLDSMISYSRMLAQQWPVWNHPSVVKQFDPDDASTQTRTIVDTEMALRDPQFVKSLQMGHSMQVLSIGVWESTLSIAERMCQEIARYSGRPCTAVDSYIPAPE